MGALTPNAVSLQDLMTETSAINVINPAAAQAVSPRHGHLDVITVKVTDDPQATQVTTGTADTNTLNHLIDSSEDFVALGVEVGDVAVNTASWASAEITAVDAGGDLTLTSDAFPLGTETYIIYKPAFYTQKQLLGEWVRAGIVPGEVNVFTYNLPTPGTASTQLVYPVIVPQATPEDTGGYVLKGA